MALLYGVSLGIYVLFSGYGIDRGYPTALYGLTRAIVEDHTLSLDGQQDLLGYDKSIYQGRLYSDKAPGPALLMVLPYSVLRLLVSDPDLLFTLTMLLGLTVPSATAPVAIWLLLKRSGAATPLLGTAAPVSISRIPKTGELLAIWNHNPGASSRNPITAAISKNEGLTWERFRNIENAPGDAWAYPAVTWLEDEALLTYFNYAGGHSLHLKIFPLDWFYLGNLE